MEQQYIKQQKKLFEKIDFNNCILISEIDCVAGVDLEEKRKSDEAKKCFNSGKRYRKV